MVLFGLVALGVKAPEVVLPMTQDQGLYAAIGQVILRGGLPYRDAFDVKTPGVYYTYAAILSTIQDPWRRCDVGPVPGLSPHVLSPVCGSLLFQAVDAVVVLGTAGLVAWVARLLGLRGIWAAWAFGFAAVFASLSAVSGSGSVSERYMLGPAVVVIGAGLRYLATRRAVWLIAASLAGAVAVLYKIPAGASLGGLALFLTYACLRGRHGLRPADLPRVALLLAVPFGAALGAVYAAFALAGAGADLLEATILYNVSRAGVDARQVPQAALSAAWRVARDGMAPLWTLALVGVVLARRAPVGGLVLAWTALDVAALFLGGSKFAQVYFLQLVPSFALLATFALRGLWNAAPPTRLPQRLWLGASLAGLLMLSASFQVGVALRAWNDYVGYGWSSQVVEKVAAVVQALPRGETVFIWGDQAQIYVLGGRMPPTRFLSIVGLSAGSGAPFDRRRAELIAALEATPPRLILEDPLTAEQDPDGRLLSNLRSFPELRAFLARRYQPVTLTSAQGSPGRQLRAYARVEGDDPCQQVLGCRLGTAGSG